MIFYLWKWVTGVTAVMEWAKERVTVITPETGAILMALLAQSGVMVSSLLDDSGLLMWCFIGSIFGAYVKVAFFPPGRKTQERNLQQLAAEFAASMFCGICLTPMALHYSTLPLNSGTVIGASFLVSIFGIAIVHAIAPFVERFVVKRAAEKTGNSDILKREPPSAIDSDFNK